MTQTPEQLGAALASYEDDEPDDDDYNCGCRRRSCDECNPDGFDRDPND